MNRKNPWLEGNSVWIALSAFPWLNYSKPTGKGGKPHSTFRLARTIRQNQKKNFDFAPDRLLAKSKKSRSGNPTGRAPPKFSLTLAPGLTHCVAQTISYF
jgi:hypothetical protein